jgi:predicted DNA-binding helix-hairpin-helix protein
MKNTPAWHLIAAVLVVTALTVILILLKLDALIAIIVPLVFAGMIGLGLIPAASQQSVTDMSAVLSAQVVAAVGAAKDDLLKLHAANAANVAALSQTVAVHAALIPDAPAPAPLIQVPVVIPAQTVAAVVKGAETVLKEAHLVTNDS